jgi:hypothetical protein
MADSKCERQVCNLRKEIENLKANFSLALEALAGLEEDQLEQSQSNRLCLNAICDRLDKIEWAINNEPVAHGTYRCELPYQK